MRILDNDNDKAINSVMLILTSIEVVELRDDLTRLLKKKVVNDHSHINDLEYEHEITVAIYESGQEHKLNERIQKLILSDE